jgi:NAD(P)-dependent dehydrogenase (short-subunit alcohol dehydrogenase family)
MSMSTSVPELRVGSLRGKVMIVTGAASGMGRATALRCAALGASVVAADLNKDGAVSVADEIGAAGGEALGRAVDLTVEDDVNGLVDATVERFGTVHVLHNNAYAVHPGAATDVVNTTLEAWDWTIRTCLTSQFLCCRAVLPHMIENRAGSIINVSSGNGLSGSTTATAYGAAKAGVVVLTKYLATQYGKFGIRVNTIVPGWTIATGWMKGEDEVAPTQRRLLDHALEDVCMTRLAVPDDIAPVVAFLASDDAKYVQAATIEVNGGLLAHMPGAAGSPARPPSDEGARRGE